MKTIKFLVLGMILAIAGSAQGQLSVNVHIGTAPAWGPRGYDNVRYYYLPDVEAYYDVNTSMFIYLSGNTWIRRNYLPSRYRGYDLYHGRKVVMNNYHGNSPYYNHKVYRAKYGRAYQGRPQNEVNRNVGNGNRRVEMNSRNERNDRNNRNVGNSRNGGSDRNSGNDRNGGKNKGNKNSGNNGKNK